MTSSNQELKFYQNQDVWLNYSKNFIALLAGLLVPFSLSPYNLKFLAFLSVILLLFSINKANNKQAIKRGYLYGIGSFGYGVSWIYISIHEHGNASALLAGFLTFLLIFGLLAFYPALKISLYKLIENYKTKNYQSSSKTLSMINFASIWILIDWLQSWLFTGFPWLYLGYSQTEGILAGYAPILSVFGLTWLIVFLAGLLYLVVENTLIFIKNNKHQYCINSSLNYLIIIISIFTIGASLSSIEWTNPIKDTENVVLVQGNIPQENRWNMELFEHNTQIYESLTDSLWQNNTIIWPEGAISLPLPYSQEIINKWQQKALINNSTLIIGIPTLANQTNQFFNSIMAIGNGNGLHNKNKLVPFGEYVPLDSLLRGLISFFDLPMSNFISGATENPHFSLLNSNTISWMPFICYEIAYPDYVINHAKNGNAIITISNDSWFGNSIGPWQHLQLAQMRALETAKPVVRVTNNGITAIINQHGKIVNQLPQFTSAVLTDKINGYTGITPIMYYGVNFIILLSFLIILLSISIPIYKKYYIQIPVN